jgi:peptidoglycan/LPS O-acetylase OafA/YrhL
MGRWRLALAWLVIVAHTNGYERVFAVDFGTVAVAAFLFISGFIMPLAYRAHYADASQHHGVRQFYLNRFLRIYPVYWVSLCLFLAAAFATYVRHGTIDPALLYLPNYVRNALLLGLNQSTLWGNYFRFNNRAWSLDVELQYYILVPFLVFALSRHRAAVVASLAIASVGSIYLFFRPTGLVDIDRSLLAWSVFFILGFAFHESATLQRQLSRLSVTVVVAVMAFVVGALAGAKSVATVALIVAFIAVSAYLLVMQKNYRFGRIDRLAGELSYPAYILHILFIGLTSKLLLSIGVQRFGTVPQFVLTALANIMITTIVAYVTFRLISEPIDRFRASVRRRHEGTTSPAGSIELATAFRAS